MAHKPTDEQQAAIDGYRTGENMVIEAAAGTGKTSTLRYIADVDPTRNGLYLAFNKAIAVEAGRKFAGTNVRASTAHALAFADFGRPMQHKLNRGRIRPSEFGERLGIRSSYLARTAGSQFGVTVQKRTVIRLVRDTVTQFCRSIDMEILPKHVLIPPQLALSEAEADDLREFIVKYARRYWQDAVDPHGSLDYTHDFYMKQWAMTDPRIDADYILFDECQPSGTKVWTVDPGHGDFASRVAQKPIEDLSEGDRLVTYSATGRLRAAGGLVTGVSRRAFDGDLVTITTASGLSTEYTPNHRCIAIMGPAFADKHVVYLMKRGRSYRIGVTGPRLVGKKRLQGVGRIHPVGVTTRLSEEAADAIWVLGAFDTRRQALLAEDGASARYGLPQTVFQENRNGSAPQPVLDEFWESFGDLTENAERALQAYGRDIRYPFAVRTGKKGSSVTFWRPKEIRASNLMDGMLVLDAESMVEAKGQWSQSDFGSATSIKVSRRRYVGDVWSMTVEPDHTYVGDGIVTHNCQDADPIMSYVVGIQANSQIVAVGDRSQAIYGWRGAVDSMDTFGGERFQLTQSFRFGHAIAQEANRWLELLDASLRVRGSDKPSSVHESIKAVPDAVLCRTNAGAMSEVIFSQELGVPVGIAGQGRAQQMRSLAEAADTLQTKHYTFHPDLDMFKSWEEVQEFVKEEEDSDLAPLVRLVDRYGPKRLIKAIDDCVSVEDARTVVSTAHSAKGLEWRHVRVSDDFKVPKTDEDGNLEDVAPGELMLNYVTVTRAIRHLDNSGLEWVRGYQRALARPELGMNWRRTYFERQKDLRESRYRIANSVNVA